MEHQIKYMLAVTYSLGRTGAPMALLNMCKYIKNMNYKILLLSNEDGILRIEYERYDIPVVIEKDLIDNYEVFKRWVNSYDYIFVNTIMYWKNLLKYEGKGKILWWIHESKEFFNLAGLTKKSSYKLSDNIKVYAVSDIPQKYFLDYFEHEISNLKYMCNKKTEIIFSIIGMICNRKGHDILYKAYKLLNPEVKNNCEIWVIGPGNVLNLSELTYEEQVGFWEDSAIKFWGEVSYEEKENLCQKTNVIVVPSRDDPLPMVVTESLLQGIPTIVTRNCGHAELIEKYNAGIVINSNEPEQLKNALEYCYYNIEEIEERGKKGKEVYKLLFEKGHQEKIINDFLEDL